MIVLKVRNVHEALPRGLELFRQHGIKRNSRNGEVLQLPEPLVTVYSHPRERVLFHPWRDANPFFHFYESLWMLSGCNRVEPLTRYVKRMAEFSDNGYNFNAAYGHRWRKARGRDESWDERGKPLDERDQLPIIADQLRKNPDTRQCVLQIWDHEFDLGRDTKDHACNLTASFQCRLGVDPKSETPWILDMVVFCRSNDMIWGGWGANAVHFSMLHEYVARRAFMAVGSYSQISVNAHIYLATAEKMLEQSQYPYVTSGEPYPTGDIYPLGNCDDQWDEDCRKFITLDGSCYDGPLKVEDSFWVDVAKPIIRTHDLWKDYRDFGRAMGELSNCQAADWRLACEQWLIRRQK